MPIVTEIRDCDYTPCASEPVKAITNGTTILGFACERHWAEVYRRARPEPSAPARLSWAYLAWVFAMLAALGFALWGLRLEWLPLVAVSQLPLLLWRMK